MSDDRNAAEPREPRRWELAVLALLPLLLYLPSLNFGYVLDDKIVVAENAFVQQGIRGIGAIIRSESLAGFIGEQPGLVVGARYRPLSLVTFALEHELYGLNASRSHLINVALYVLTVLGVYRFFRSLASGCAADHGFARLPFLAALLFALHPLHTEVVANIKGRDEILALLLSLASVLLLVRFARGGSPLALAMSAPCFLLALLAKENAITFLAVAPLTLFVFTEAKPRTLGAAMLPMLAAALLYLALRDHAVGFALLGDRVESADLMNNPFVEASTEQRYGTIFYTWGLYLKLLFFPHPLTHDYYPYQIPLIGISDLRAIAPLVAFLAMLAGAFAALRRGAIAPWSLLYFLATFSIVSNLAFPVGTFMNERFLYMPSLGFCALLAWILTSRLPRWLGAWPRLARCAPLAIAALFALGFAFKAAARLPDWKDDLSLNRAGVKVSTGSARIHCFIAYSLYEAAQREGDDARVLALLGEAESYLKRSLEIFPGYRDALAVYAGVLSERYLIDGKIEPLLEGFFDIARRNEPPHVEEFLAWLNRQQLHREELAEFYFELGEGHFLRERGDAGRAERYLSLGLEVAPDDVRILDALAELWLARAAAGEGVTARRDAYRALTYAQRSSELDPASARSFELAAQAHERLGDAASAARTRERARGEGASPSEP